MWPILTPLAYQAKNLTAHNSPTGDQKRGHHEQAIVKPEAGTLKGIFPNIYPDNSKGSDNSKGTIQKGRESVVILNLHTVTKPSLSQ